MIKQAAALRHAVRLHVILKYFGQLCLVLAGLTVVPFCVSLFFQDIESSTRYILIIVSLGGLGGVLSRLEVPVRVQMNEGMVLVALMFLFTPLVMSYPMMATGLSFQDALFEAISGGTTTGLSALSTLEGTSSTFLFARAWMQWYGGLGIVVLSLALVADPGLVAKGLSATEAEQEDLVGGMKKHTKRVLIVYCALTGFGIIGLWLLGVDPFSSILYTFAAVSTGGFSPHDGSLAGLNSWSAQAWVTVCCVLGAVPLAFYHVVSQRKWPPTMQIVQLRALLISGMLVSLLLGWCLWQSNTLSLSDSVLSAPLMAFSAQSTAGFATHNLADFDPGSKLTLIVAMMIGGGVGSTAGGFKILRLLIFLRLLQIFILRICVPRHTVIEPRVHGERLSDSQIREALTLIILFGTVILISWFPFVIMGYDPLDALFEVVSATGTAGLSVGITSSELPDMLKAVLCADMLMGRLEILAWLVLFFPGTWIGRRSEER